MLKLVSKGQAVEEKTKERYLLFDSGCSECTGIARAVEEETGGWLTARSLNDPEVQEMLSKADPKWRFQPTLLEIDGERTLAFTGIAMKVRMLVGLGPRRAARVAKIARQDNLLDLEITVKPSEEDPERYEIESIKRFDRRTVLKGMAAFSLGAALLPLLPQGAIAEERGASTHTRIRVKQLTAGQIRSAFDVLRRRVHGGMMYADLQRRGFSLNLRGATGMVHARTMVTAGSTITATNARLTVMVPYKHATSGETSMVRLSVTGSSVSIAGDVVTAAGGKEDAEFGIWTRGGGLGIYGVVSGSLTRTKWIANLKEEQRRFQARYGRGTSSRTSTSRSASGCVFYKPLTGECVTGCTICSAVVSAIGGVGVGGFSSLLFAGLICTNPIGFAYCAGTVAAVAGIAFALGVNFTGAADFLCAGNGYC